MESVINSETVHSTKTALDDFFEQKVDFDIVLPDYCPAVERILNCNVVPSIITKSLEGEKVLLDIQCKATIVYTDDSGNIHSVCKTENFTKTLLQKIPLCIARMRTTTRAVSVNCRMQNSRKINIKSVIGTAVKIMGGSECQIIGEAHSGGIEAIFDNVSANTLCATGEVSTRISGQLSLKPTATEIITATAAITITDKKIMTDKVLVRGEADLSVVYMSGEGTDNFSFFEGSIPFSEVIDVYGAVETGDCDVKCDIQNVHCELASDDGTLGCDIDVLLSAALYTQNRINFLKDIYSMNDNLTVSKSDVALESFCDSIGFSQTVSGSISCDFSEARIIGICADSFVKNVELRDTALAVEGDMAVTIYMCNDGDYAITEKNIPFCVSHPMGNICDGMRCEADVKIKNLSYSMPNDQEIIVSADAETVINCFTKQNYSAIDSVEIGDSHLDLCKGVVIYYGESGEKLWDIAKKYRSSVDIIKRDNSIDGDTLEQNKMLLISFN